MMYRAQPSGAAYFRAIARTLLLVLAAVAASCGGLFGAEDDVPRLVRQEGRFAVSLQLSQTDAVDSGRLCDVPIVGASSMQGNLRPETGLIATLSQGGDRDALVSTNVDGVASISADRDGFYHLTLAPTDAIVTARLSMNLQSLRTTVRGGIKPDYEDLDGDGDAPWTVVAEVLPDADGDRISDTGTKAFWVCHADGGTVLRHLGRGVSERVVLDSEHFDVESTLFEDRDGDWIPDAEDDDQDGDGQADADEATPLACPGFSHEQLVGPDNAHDSLPCSGCHRGPVEAPSYCHDCHAETGRAWIGRPDDTPSAHFGVDCQLCHRADSPWSAVPGSNGEDHSTYPLTGRHLTTSCFACHITGNIEVPRTCEECHAADTPERHFDSACDNCHTADSWDPGAKADEGTP